VALTRIDSNLVVNSGMSRVQGCDCKNNSGTPDTQFDLDCDAVVLRDSDGSTVTRYNPGTAITNNVSTAGPSANGRDQSGAFSTSSWIHFYWIWNGATLATVSSATAPPTGPTLPSGYTHWAYAGAVRFDGSSHLVRTIIRGCIATIAPVTVRALASGTGSEQSYDHSANIPPNHLGALISLHMNTISIQGDIRASSSGQVVLGSPASGAIAGAFHGCVPLASQTIYFIGNAGGTQAIMLNGYKLPNGGE